MDNEASEETNYQPSKSHDIARPLEEGVETAREASASASPPTKRWPLLWKKKPRKNPGRVAVGKRVEEFNQKARQEKKYKWQATLAVALNSIWKINENNRNNESYSFLFSLTLTFSMVRIVVSMVRMIDQSERAV